MTPRGPSTGACRISHRFVWLLIPRLSEPCGQQHEDRGLTDLLRGAEHVAGQSTDLPLREPRHGGRARRCRQRGAEPVDPRQQHKSDDKRKRACKPPPPHTPPPPLAPQPAIPPLTP